MAYDRPWKSFGEQLDLLVVRGIVVTDRATALSYLERIGYYRLSAYWYPFRLFGELEIQGRPIRQDQFAANTCFADAVDLYVFDKRLRLLALDALERIEVALRVDIAHLLGKRDTFAHLHVGNFHPSFANRPNSKTGKTQHQTWLEKYQGLMVRSKEDFLKHYRERHGQNLPIWVAVELLDFGAVSTLFAMMKVKDQQTIAAKYGVADWQVFQSWLRALNYLRNLAAHHSRLWNRNIVDVPKLPEPGSIAFCDPFIGQEHLINKPFLLFCIAGHLLRYLCPATSWHRRMVQHLQGFPTLSSSIKLSLRDMGAVENWQDLLCQP